ncbi:MAG: MerR family transcriptional regulator [Candidatus Omnitrophica bacterium]|nr:MerR family transcriptional regulator [Candidatus Omnitrophota bacterium]
MNIYTLRDYYYDIEKSIDITTSLYGNVKKISPLLQTPSFTLKDCQKCIPELTYRKINDWDRKDLITGARVNKRAGWRKFSIIDLVKLLIICDLRRFGLHIENIKSILSKISNAFVEDDIQHNLKRSKFLQLEHYIVCSFLKDKILLLIDSNQNITFFKQNEAIKYYFKFDKAKDPVIILPFFSYVEKIKKASKEKHK